MLFILVLYLILIKTWRFSYRAIVRAAEQIPAGARYNIVERIALNKLPL